MSESHLGESIHAYVDNELSVERSLEARSHLAACPRCRKDLEEIRALRDVLQRTLKPAEPSGVFLRQLQHSVRRADRARWRTRVARAAWVSGPLAAAALVVLFAVPSLRPPPEDVTGEVVTAHLRSLQAGHLTDVPSSDRHTVKPWFQGKVPYSLTVRDFREQGFALEGGRLDYVNGQPVAALVYRSRQHVINAFIWPAPAAHDGAQRSESRTGIHVLHWEADGMATWLVSDIGDGELERLATLLREPSQ
jgi:anti-sigma factor RsiW